MNKPKYKYSYTVGEFTKKSTGEEDLYNMDGWDARSWTLTDKKKEISKEEYLKLVIENTKIVEAYWKNFRLRIKTFHNPRKERV